MRWSRKGKPVCVLNLSMLTRGSEKCQAPQCWEEPGDVGGGGWGREGRGKGGVCVLIPTCVYKSYEPGTNSSLLPFSASKGYFGCSLFSTLFGVVSIFLRSSSAAVVVCSYRTHNSPPTPLFKFYFLLFYFTGHSAIKELLLLLLLFRRVGVYIKTLEIF